MKILVACEYSGIVRDAFIARGHDATSCDILPTDRPGPHVQGDVAPLLTEDWDMIIAFPPCTRLSCIGATHWAKWQADGSQDQAAEFFMMFANANCDRIAIENPAGAMSRRWRKPDQYVDPYWFGDPWKKRTGLWLKGLPLLTATNLVEPKGHWVDGGSMTKKGQSAASREGSYGGAALKSNGHRAHERSKTFQGLANAMAEQWGR